MLKAAKREACSRGGTSVSVSGAECCPLIIWYKYIYIYDICNVTGNRYVLSWQVCECDSRF